MKKEEIHQGNKKNKMEMNPVIKTTMWTVLQAHFPALSGFLAPRFCPTRAAAAWEKPKQTLPLCFSFRAKLPFQNVIFRQRRSNLHYV